LTFFYKKNTPRTMLIEKKSQYGFLFVFRAWLRENSIQNVSTICIFIF